MPGAFAHLAVLDASIGHMPFALKQACENNRNFAMYGAIGPDYLYFYKNDWGEFGKVGELVFQAFDLFKEQVALYNTIQDAIDNIRDWLSGGLHSEIEKSARLIQGSVLSLVAEFVTAQKDFFEEFKPPISGSPEGAAAPHWWWADIAHQRRTNQLFALWIYCRDTRAKAPRACSGHEMSARRR